MSGAGYTVLVPERGGIETGDGGRGGGGHGRGSTPAVPLTPWVSHAALSSPTADAELPTRAQDPAAGPPPTPAILVRAAATGKPHPWASLQTSRPTGLGLPALLVRL